MYCENILQYKHILHERANLKPEAFSKTLIRKSNVCFIKTKVFDMIRDKTDSFVYTSLSKEFSSKRKNAT